jgi:hypothetical protein
MAFGDGVAAGTREWLDADDVRHDLELILAQLSKRQLRLVRRLSVPGRHPMTRAELAEAGAVNWIVAGFWFRLPLLRVDRGDAVMTEEARTLIATLLEPRPGSESTARPPGDPSLV